MDDDSKEYRRNKPQQKFYEPGSGPLRRSSYGSDAKMDQYGPQNSVNDDVLNEKSKDYSMTNTRHKKPEQQLYVPRSGDTCLDDRQSKHKRSDNSSQYNNKKMFNRSEKHGYGTGSGSYSRGASRRDRPLPDNHYKDRSNDLNYNRQSRQVSETRSMSPTHCTQQKSNTDRNRDSRSMETSAGRHMSGGGGKPPSGRRNSAGYSSDSSRSKYSNLDNVPPRFRKNILEQSGHSFDSIDKINRDRHASNPSIPPSYNQGQFSNSNLTWSQTLPSRGRGRLRDNESFDREKFINSYLKNYDVHNSRRSTPSSSYMNLYEPNVLDNQNEKNVALSSSIDNQAEYNDNSIKNGINDENSDVSFNHSESKQESDSQHDNETISQITSSLLDMTYLDWTEEVEKNIKFDDMGSTSASFSKNIQSSELQENKSSEPRDSKRSTRPRRKDRRSSSRGHRNSEKKSDRNRKDSNNSIQHELDKNRKDSNTSVQQEIILSNLKQRERERRDSHKSNRSSTIGNSRDDLDRWRSLRSYSREHSSERRIVSQCNSRDTSTVRAVSPRDNEGFRIPTSKSAVWSSGNQKNGAWASGRTPSTERGRQSPMMNNMVNDGGGDGPAGSGRRNRKRLNRRRVKQSDGAQNNHPSHSTHTAHHVPGLASSTSTSTNWREEILESKKQATHDRQSDGHSQRNILNAMSEKSISENASHPGLIVLPQSSINHIHKDHGRVGTSENQKLLYDHQNPSKPIIVQTGSNKGDVRMDGCVRDSGRFMGGGGGGGSGGLQYEAGEAARAARHRTLLQKVDRADAVLQTHALRGPLALAAHWNDVADTRSFLQNTLHQLLMSDLKYCQSDNIEHHFWKILYYNFIEVLRKSFSQVSPDDKPKIVHLINIIIEEGNVFFENLVQMLEKTYKFNIEEYINDNHLLPPKGLGYVGLALISVQKLYIFLGDLARYKEQVNETNNYAKSKFWYTKAQQINPKNGRPYNQLAILAVYARRKLDAVYYYMRSLMSSNPFSSARESLISLFDENRKKYEAAERKRRVALENSRSAENGSGNGVNGVPGGLRREVWVRPSGHRTTTLRHHAPDDRLATMTSVELNKNFITSYLHVHGKLFTKIGMETFHESASEMLRQFRALLHRQPLPTPAARLLQLTALNMYAVETTTSSLKDESNSGKRSAWLDCALGVSLLMFGALLERCCALLPEPAHTQHHTDALLLLPAIKVWSDWMLCHSSIWNPPPEFNNFEMESENDPWDWLAKLMNILEALDDKSIELENEVVEGYVSIRLAEDASLGGFTPLMYMEPAIAWVRPEPAVQQHAAEHALRLRKLLFFGTEYLVGVEPPVLRLEYPASAPPRYVSAVQRAQPHNPPLQHLSEDSEEEDSVSAAPSELTSLTEGLEGSEGADETTLRLLRRKEQLESRKATLDRRRERMQEILGGGGVSVEVEVRPRWLVPDTNCFIDHLPLLQSIAEASTQPYTLVVPLVVITELEGLKKCSRVGERASAALAWVCACGTGGAGGAVRLATSLGNLLLSRAFTAERDHSRATNDDRVLATAVNLHTNLATETDTRVDDGSESKFVKRVREVVLLTDDRNLRVKALAAELPARDLPSFIQWASLTNTDADTASSVASGDKSNANN